VKKIAGSVKRTSLVIAVALLVNAGTVYANDIQVCVDAVDKEQWTIALPACAAAANLGNAAAQFALGAMYSNGQGVAQDYKEATRWYRQAAAQGVSQAQFNLGNIYSNGRGVAQDYKEAVRWYRQAAVQGDARAQYNLGNMYSNGRGVAQDFKETARWWKRAAAQGLAEAQFNLGVMHGEGRGAVQDYVRAHMWFNIAAANGDQESLKGRDVVAARMTPAQIARAQEMARKCVEKGYQNCD